MVEQEESSTTTTGRLEGPALPENKDVFRDTQGRYRTKSLFKELNTEGDYPYYFTLKPVDQPDAVSMRRKYLEIADPTEYAVAERLLGSWDHWQKLLKVRWFKEAVEQWREELRIKLRSHYYEKMHTYGRRDDQLGYSATKFWMEETKPPKKRGRPSKAEVEAELKRTAEDSKLTDQDAERLGLL